MATEQTEQIILTRRVYEGVRSRFLIMPNVLCEWLESQNNEDAEAVKMYLTVERDANTWQITPYLRRLPLRTQQMYTLGSRLFNSWDTKNAIGGEWKYTALLRHIARPWETKYALMDDDELFRAESTEFDTWCCRECN